MNIQQKIVEVKKSMTSFTKDASGYGYKYVSGSQILKEIKGKMDELGILLEQHLLYPVISQTPKGFMMTSQMKMIWVNAEKPDDRIVVDWYCTGEQKDPSQAFGSALTYSERYFLLKYLGVPTDEDDPDKLLANGNRATAKAETKSTPKPKADPDTQLKKDLMKKHKNDAEAAKKEYMEILKSRQQKLEVA
jgi:hypothetical protein